MSTTDDDEMMCDGAGDGHSILVRWPPRGPFSAEDAAANPCAYHAGRNLLAVDVLGGGRYFLSPGWTGPTECSLVHRSNWE